MSRKCCNCSAIQRVRRHTNLNFASHSRVRNRNSIARITRGTLFPQFGNHTVSHQMADIESTYNRKLVIYALWGEQSNVIGTSDCHHPESRCKTIGIETLAMEEDQLERIFHFWRILSERIDSASGPNRVLRVPTNYYTRTGFGMCEPPQELVFGVFNHFATLYDRSVSRNTFRERVRVREYSKSAIKYSSQTKPKLRWNFTKVDREMFGRCCNTIHSLWVGKLRTFPRHLPQNDAFPGVFPKKVYTRMDTGNGWNATRIRTRRWPRDRSWAARTIDDSVEALQSGNNRPVRWISKRSSRKKLEIAKKSSLVKQPIQWGSKLTWTRTKSLIES